MMFRELVNVRYSARKFADVPLFRTMQWGWFDTCMPSPSSLSLTLALTLTLFRTMQWGCFDTGMPTPIPIPSCSCSRSP
jgi:hypothetical protein